MAKQKNYNNYAEVVGNAAKISVSEKTGEMRFSIATHHKYTRKNGEAAEETHFIRVMVRPGRKYADQSVVEKGCFLRVIGHLEDNSYKTEDGTWKGGLELCADKIVVLSKKEADEATNTPEDEAPTE